MNFAHIWYGISTFIGYGVIGVFAVTMGVAIICNTITAVSDKRKEIVNRPKIEAKQSKIFG